MELTDSDRRLGELRQLVARAVRAPEDDGPSGASQAEIDALQERLGQDLPPVLRMWLSVCRGAAIGPGGVFGQRPDRPFLDMPRLLALFPQWRDLGWLPVASDGCGSYYVLTPNGPVGFVDVMKDPGQLDRQAAPDLLSFMSGLLRADQQPPDPPARY